MNILFMKFQKKIGDKRIKHTHWSSHLINPKWRQLLKAVETNDCIFVLTEIIGMLPGEVLQ